jgi:hypothetical protein
MKSRFFYFVIFSMPVDVTTPLVVGAYATAGVYLRGPQSELINR